MKAAQKKPPSRSAVGTLAGALNHSAPYIQAYGYVPQTPVPPPYLNVENPYFYSMAADVGPESTSIPIAIPTLFGPLSENSKGQAFRCFGIGVYSEKSTDRETETDLFTIFQRGVLKMKYNGHPIPDFPLLIARDRCYTWPTNTSGHGMISGSPASFLDIFQAVPFEAELHWAEESLKDLHERHTLSVIFHGILTSPIMT